MDFQASEFGAGFYEMDSKTLGYEALNSSGYQRIKLILDTLRIGAHDHVERIVANERNAFHSRLRSATQLGGAGKGMRVVIEVVDHLPLPVQRILDQLPDGLLWALFHRLQIQQTGQGLKSVLEAYDLITDPHHGVGGSVVSEAIRKEDIERTRDFLERVDSSLVQKAVSAVSAILESRGDVLGAYFFRERRIELYWVVIWIVAVHLDVSVEDLTAVVLAHEMAHFYTHVGNDADGHDWVTDAFARSDNFVVEGLAQFYTEAVLNSLNDGLREGWKRAFYELLRHQSPAYTDWGTWAPSHRKRSEVVRRALVRARQEPLVSYDLFKHFLEESRRSL